MGESLGSLRNVRILTPGRILYRVFAVFLVLWFGVGWIASLASHIDVARENCRESEIRAQTLSIERRLALGEDELMNVIIPEGALFCNTLFGFSLICQGKKLPRTSPERIRLLERLERLIAKVESLRGRYPFELNAGLNPPGGIIISGHENLLRAGYCTLGGRRPDIVAAFGRQSRLISDAILATPSGFPQCYKGYTWAQDCVFAVDSLRIHDELFGTDYSAAIDKYVRGLKEHIDPVSGLMIAQVDPASGKSIEGARGCAAAWGLSVLPSIDADFSRGQYALFRKSWYVDILGCRAVHEWYRGKSTRTNFHAGPVVFGMGAAASGISIAAARRAGDRVSFNRLLRSLELVGLPFYTAGGEKYYFFRLCLMADVVSLWGKTIEPFDNAEVSASPEQNREQTDLFWLVLVLVGTLSIVTVVTMAKNLVSMLRDDKVVRASWSKTTTAGLLLQAGCVVLFFLSGTFSFLQIFIFMTMIDLVEAMAVRPAIIGKLYDS